VKITKFITWFFFSKFLLIVYNIQKSFLLRWYHVSQHAGLSGQELIRLTASKLVDSPRLRKQYICSCLPQHEVVCSIHNLREHHTAMAGDSKLESQYI